MKHVFGHISQKRPEEASEKHGWTTVGKVTRLISFDKNQADCLPQLQADRRVVFASSRTLCNELRFSLKLLDDGKPVR